ncbi:MAG: right-handed parallel beta-helix repeat-containing protein [Candidatus Thermoplasmatota archaeon]|nr:right-handed parallel beta-helix repeat-containing protein [Candidatus Thermoplasmatota archaeon]
MTDCLVIADALVDDDFRDDPDAHEWDTITEGLSDVENGGIIYIFNGSYASIEIAKSVSLYGESRENVRINSGNPGVKIRYHNVTIDGFNISSGTIRMDVSVKSDENHSSNVTITNCNILGSGTIGILVNQSSGCLIENCTIQGNTYDVKITNDSQYNVMRKCVISQGDYGVYVSDSSYNFIGSPSIINPYPTDCLFTNTLCGIKLEDSDHNFILGCDIDGTPCSSSGISGTTKGIYLDNSENNTISTCSVHDMADKGMYLVDSTWNKIEHCKISWNPIGITFDNSPENLLAQNHFGGNAEFAVYMPTDTQFNHVYYNDFFVNGNGSTNQTWDANGAKGAENLWSKDGNKTLTKTGDGEGNFWSDYAGVDDDEDGIGDTPYEINSSGIKRNDTYPVMKPYGWCNFTQDSTLPVITNVSATPHTVGFGYNVTIQAGVTDNGSNISLVKVEVTYPDESTGNYTMECSGDSLYEYVFTDTWLTGQYNYTIWAMDDSYNSNSSSGHHFHVSADASISIATLKNSYSGTEYINITDPPNPPENYTLVDRGLTWDEYYNADTGQNILEVSAGPINYQNDTNTWTPINNTLTQLASNHPAYVYGYRQGNDRGLFGVYFKSNAQQEWPVAYAFDRSDDPTIHVIRSKLVGVGYVDPQSNWAYQYLQNVQSSQGQVSDYSVTYPDVFTGTDVTWSYGNTGLKEEITLSNTTKTVLQSHPPSQYGLNNASSYLVFITKLDYQNLNIYNDSGLLDGNVTISDIGVEFKDLLGQFKCALPLGEAFELNNESMREKLIYRIIHLNGNTYLLSGLNVSDLNAMTFPVVIDPTIQQLQIGSLTDDGDISNYSTSYTTVQSAPAGTVSSSSTTIYIGQSKFLSFPNPTYHIYRGYLMFNTSSLPENAYVTDAYISLYKHSDYSTNDFTITVQNGQPTYPHIPLVSADYYKSYYSGNGGGLNTSSFVNGRNSIPLTNYSWLQKEGMTKFCLRSSKDISGTAPTTAEYVIVYSRNGAPQYMPKLYITYRDQSKIKNTGSTDITGYLLIQVQYYNSSQGLWLVEDDTINETSPRTVTSGNQLALDTIFNGLVRASDLTHGTGVTYRVYTAFRDPDGNILRTNDDVELVDSWQFSKT